LAFVVNLGFLIITLHYNFINLHVHLVGLGKLLCCIQQLK